MDVDSLLKLLDGWPLWKRLRGAPAEIDELRQRLASLEARIAKPAGQRCPKCGQWSLMLEASEPAPTFGVFGVLSDHMRCAECGHMETRQRDPSKQR